MRIIFVALFSIICLGCGRKTKSAGVNTSAQNEVQLIDQYLSDKNYKNYKEATFAGGSFWNMEAVFERVEGVIDVISGYAGGEQAFPSYKEVGTGTTGYAESIQIYYDPNKTNYTTLLRIFFAAHDPSQRDRQGPDIGPEFRSLVFYRSEEEKEWARQVVNEVDNSHEYKRPAVTRFEPFTSFWTAENHHQNFVARNADHPYVKSVTQPILEKVEKRFKQISKKRRLSIE